MTIFTAAYIIYKVCQNCYLSSNSCSQWELEKLTRLEETGRTRHALLLRERLAPPSLNPPSLHDFTKSEKVCGTLLLILFV